MVWVHGPDPAYLSFNLFWQYMESCSIELSTDIRSNDFLDLKHTTIAGLNPSSASMKVCDGYPSMSMNLSTNRWFAGFQPSTAWLWSSSTCQLMLSKIEYSLVESHRGVIYHTTTLAPVNRSSKCASNNIHYTSNEWKKTSLVLLGPGGGITLLLTTTRDLKTSTKKTY